MAEFKKKVRPKFWHSPLALGVLFCLLAIFSYNMIGLIKKDRETARKRDLASSELQRLHDREKSLNADLELLKTDEGIEATIREKYQVAKEGEKVVVIVEQDSESKNLQKSEESHRGFLSFIKNIFK